MVFDATNGSIGPVRRVDREFHGEKLSTVLKTLLEPLKLDYCITEEKVVLFTEPEKAHQLGK